MKWVALSAARSWPGGRLRAVPAASGRHVRLAAARLGLPPGMAGGPGRSAGRAPRIEGAAHSPGAQRPAPPHAQGGGGPCGVAAVARHICWAVLSLLGFFQPPSPARSCPSLSATATELPSVSIPSSCPLFFPSLCAFSNSPSLSQRFPCPVRSLDNGLTFHASHHQPNVRSGPPTAVDSRCRSSPSFPPSCPPR